MWDLSSPARDRTHTPCIVRQRLNHWTAREVPRLPILYCLIILLLKRSSRWFTISCDKWVEGD